MPDDHADRMAGKVRGIVLSGKAGEAWERIFGKARLRSEDPEANETLKDAGKSPRLPLAK